MNSILRASIAHKVLSKYPTSYFKTLIIKRGGIHLHRDFKPGPYPETEEERLAAAKKYNLLPIEYEPYDEDDEWGCSYGDYPHLPSITFDDSDPWRAWTIPARRKDWGDPLHVNAHLISLPGGINYNLRVLLTFWQTIRGLIILLSVFGVVAYCGEVARLFAPQMQRHRPHLGDFYYYPGEEEELYDKQASWYSKQ